MPVLLFHSKSSSPDKAADERLVELAQSGDSAAFAELVRRHNGSVYKLALRFVAQREDAEDIAQETWLSVYVNLPSFRRECSFRSWLWHIARNQSLEYLRTAKRSAVDLAKAPLDDQCAPVEAVPSKAKSPEVQLAEREMHSLALAAIQSLKPRYRQPLYLWVIEDHDITEIAAMTGATYLAAKMALFRARLAAQARVRQIMLLGQHSLMRDRTPRKSGPRLAKSRRNAA